MILKQKGFSLIYQENIPVLRIDVDVCCCCHKALEDTIMEKLKNNKQLVVILGENNYLDDSTLETIIAALKSAWENKTKMYVVCQKQDTYDTFALLNLDYIYPIFMSLDEVFANIHDDRDKQNIC